ncbi:hypothetical protein DUNSADRAFT_14647 [Dunaliella salina]|uniref:Uncharacterized protein n=1 Tax=Dunaliella salina TaxID=3046 RepID=A0ABQ7G740_DUNSA|nr:hypothetical protein DUNSADRAFT_14647 [Dunaliella salina]|eukprot:KAF5830403.1 hypothetical protein DUNSADRAFT_14647 [Dunaliella salina]
MDNRRDASDRVLSHASASTRAQGAVQDEDVIGYLPGYAIPSISSLLPGFTNAEQDFINRTFSTGNYDFLKHLPDDIRYRQVANTRTARMEATRQFLLPALSGPLLNSKPPNSQGLFQAFEYIPSRIDLAREADSRARVESEAKRMAIGGKEFMPAGDPKKTKNESTAPGQTQYPYLGGPYMDAKGLSLLCRVSDTAKMQLQPFTPPGNSKHAQEKPTKTDTFTMMENVRKWIAADWEGIKISIFENKQDCWVLKIDINTVESLEGLLAYMNVFVRCNKLVNQYGLTKAADFWHTQPEDGHVYYVVRPPWVSTDKLQAFFTLFPEEQHWETSHAVQELERSRPFKDEDESTMDTPRNKLPTPLSYASRLNWGRNFYTGSPASKRLGVGHTF